MKNPAGKPMPTASHDRSQFTDKNPSRNEAGRCLFSLDQWKNFVSDPVLRNALAECCVAPRRSEASPKTTECPREGVSTSLAGATTLVTTQAGHSQGTVELHLGHPSPRQWCGRAFIYFIYSHGPEHFSTQPRRYWKCTWGQHLDIPDEERDLTLLGAVSTIKQLLPWSSMQSPVPVLQRLIHVFNCLNRR